MKTFEHIARQHNRHSTRSGSEGVRPCINRMPSAGEPGRCRSLYCADLVALLLLLLNAFAFAQAADALKLPAALPAGLTDAEAQLIRKEQNPKGHVEAVARVADARVLQALKQAQTDEAQAAEAALKGLELYGALLSYADDYTRRLPVASVKERNKILKILEQAIFKQQRNLEGARQALPFEAREQTEKLVAAIKRIRLRAIDDVLGNGAIIK